MPKADHTTWHDEIINVHTAYDYCRIDLLCRTACDYYHVMLFHCYVLYHGCQVMLYAIIVMSYHVIASLHLVLIISCYVACCHLAVIFCI